LVRNAASNNLSSELEARIVLDRVEMREKKRGKGWQRNTERERERERENGKTDSEENNRG